MKSKLTEDSNHELLISLNVNRLNSPIKRHRVTDWIQKNRNHSLSAYKKHISTFKGRYHHRVKGWEKYTN